MRASRERARSPRPGASPETLSAGSGPARSTEPVGARGQSVLFERFMVFVAPTSPVVLPCERVVLASIATEACWSRFFGRAFA